jgi:hypothetical protein
MIRAQEIPIKPGLVRNAVEHNESMIGLRKAVRKRLGVSDNEATSLAERLLGNAVKRFGAKYLNEMAEHIERLFELRQKAAGVLEKVLGAEELSPADASAELEGIFRDIKSHMDEITDPEKFAKKKPIKMADDELSILTDEQEAEAARLKAEETKSRARKSGKKAVRSGRHAEQTKVFKEKFGGLKPANRKAVQKAAKVAPRELWRAVTSETEGGLERNIEALRARAKERGLTAPEIDRLEASARELSLERARSQRLPGTAEAVQRAEGVKNLVSNIEKMLADDPEFKKSSLRGLDPKALRQRLAGLKKLVEGDRFLESLAAENPKQLLEFFEGSGARSRSALRRYIRGRMVSHIRGLLGEFTAAFRLGEEGVILLKGPDYNVTIPGTDLVGVTKDGRIWLIDNKALTAEELSSVTALTRNIATNIADDSAAFIEGFGRRRDRHIGDAVARLDRTNKAIQKLTKGMDPKEIGTARVQKEIAAICKRNQVDRVVTNAGGQVEGLSNGLTKAKIAFEDLNAPVTDDPTITE